MLLTATEVTVLSNITASAYSITNSGLIETVQERINFMTNNYFVSELCFEDNATFNATARTIVMGNVHLEDYNFLASDDIYIYGSYRNDGYYTLLSVSGHTATLITGQTVIDELSGQTILFSVVRWPKTIKYAAAQMIAYDYDVRPSKSANVKSRSLGPASETYSDNEDEFGYPKSITEPLTQFRIARCM